MIYVDIDEPLEWFWCGGEDGRGHLCGPFRDKIVRDQCGQKLKCSTAHVGCQMSLRHLARTVRHDVHAWNGSLTKTSCKTIYPSTSSSIVVESTPSDISLLEKKVMIEKVASMINAKLGLQQAIAVV